MNQTFENLPAYLTKYVSEQPPDKYTSRDHAVWRFIMRQSREFFKDHALPIYLDGLEKTGITLDRIPRIDDMDRKLRDIGWGAIPVTGFIPPAAFLDFQARRILPIAADMRSIDHVHYTPAPDIVHEAAGHAPILADAAYSEYLTKYAAMAQKAIFAQEDLELYDAIRALSDIKENPDSTPALIEHAEKKLEAAVKAVSFVSEANKTARMNWWTVEYGLLGSMQDPKIYGAGLLSSVGESQNCLSDHVKKIPLSVACVEQTYDITEPQPQLFVAESLQHLTHVLEEFEATLSFRRGGAYGLEQALKGQTLTTARLDSGMEVSGVLTNFTKIQQSPHILTYKGDVQISYHGKETFRHIFSEFFCVLGFPVAESGSPSNKPPTKSTLEELGLIQGKRSSLNLRGNITVEGHIEVIQCDDNGAAMLILWRDCILKQGDKILGSGPMEKFPMVLGTEVISVYGGPADRDAFGAHNIGDVAKTSPARETPYSQHEIELFDLYGQLRQLRETSLASQTQPQSERENIGSKAITLAEEFAKSRPKSWLLRLEAIELCFTTGLQKNRGKDIEQLQENLKSDARDFPVEVQQLVNQGIDLAATAD